MEELLECSSAETPVHGGVWAGQPLGRGNAARCLCLSFSCVGFSPFPRTFAPEDGE